MSSRKEQKQAAREERLRREREARDAATRRRFRVRLALAGAALLALALIAVPLVTGVDLLPESGKSAEGKQGSYALGSVPAQEITGLRAAAKAADCVLEDPELKEAVHVQGKVVYHSTPPTSGPHSATPAADGVYVEPPPIEKLVHPLEHGNIVIWFSPSLPERMRSDLMALYNEDAVQMLLTPSPEPLPYAVAASAWGHLIGCKSFNLKTFDALRAFRDKYRGQGPEAV